MRRQQLLLRSVLFESAEWLHIDPTRSWETIQQRTRDEGIGFTNITMPQMHDHVLLCVSVGHWIPNRSFATSKGRPVFLQEFLGLIFDFGVSFCPVKRGDNAALALRCLRQILLLTSKVKVLPSPARQTKAIESFFDIESDLRELKHSILEVSGSDLFRKVCHILYGKLFDDCQKQLEDAPYKHGPGQSAESSFGINKYATVSTTWTSRLERQVRAADCAFYNTHDLLDSTNGTGDYAVIEPRDELPMKVILVPKTAKTPRIIAMEPVAKQWVQQGILSLIDKNIQLDPLLKGAVSWRDQDRNRSLAQLGSLTGHLATLDLSEASDRLHVGVVSTMLKNYPVLRGLVLASRSNEANYQGRTIRLHKFAPMGSAMCFAFESLAFLAIVVTAITLERGAERSSKRSILKSLDEVSVYGDDIIVPTHYAKIVVYFLEAFGLKVNRRKSFWNGYFRESCGGDYFNGHDVTVTRLRVDPDEDLRPEDLLSWIDTQNQFFRAGYYATAEYMESLFRAPSHNHEVLGAFAYLSDREPRTRYNRDLQRLEYEALVPVFRKQKITDSGREMLFHWFVVKQLDNEPPKAWEDSKRPVILASRPQIARLRTTFVA